MSPDMDYFEWFGLPVRLKTDKALLRQRYLELSRKYHPDYFVQEEATAQAEALDASARLNEGYKTLNDGDRTIAYVLMTRGLLEEEEKYNLPPDFLMEVMELSEEVQEAGFDPDPNKKAALYPRIVALEKEIYEPVAEIVESSEEGGLTEEALLRVKDYYFKKKYLSRLYSGLENKS
ncbi:MAG TPA: Fe-S protein assembly co-chaperone HscB [Chitinophagaceae bacterium]|nr:Fe-S protein assembly co-chaperone HscB [Chitinophagaceae bacterium]